MFRLLQSKSGGGKKKQRGPRGAAVQASALRLQALEPRVLLDAAAAQTLQEVAQPAATGAPAGDAHTAASHEVLMAALETVKPSVEPARSVDTSTAVNLQSQPIAVARTASDDASVPLPMLVQAQADVSTASRTVVDLNSGSTMTERVTNGSFGGSSSPNATGWTAGGTLGSGGGATGNSTYRFVGTPSATLTQSSISDWGQGVAGADAARVQFFAGWTSPPAGQPDAAATLQVSVNGVIYMRILTRANGATSAAIEYLNGASGSRASLTKGDFPTMTLNLPSDVASSGDLKFEYVATNNNGNPISFGSVSVLKEVDSVAGTSFAGTYTENGSARAIAGSADSIRGASGNLQSATIALTNASAGDTLAVGTLPTGITSSIDKTSVPGQIFVRLSGSATAADYATAIRAVSFSSSSESPGTAPRSLTVTVNDGVQDSQSATSNISVQAVNDAPVLADTVLTMSVEDVAGAPVGAVGSLVSSLVGGVSDVDAGASKGVAVTATVTTNGSWWFSLDNGATWQSMGTVSNTSARLLAADGQTRVYFQPRSGFNGDAGNALTFRAWDQTNGVANGALSSTATNGGTSAFSSGTDTVAVTVIAVNDAPVLGTGTRNLSAISEDLNASVPAAAPVGAVGTSVTTFAGTITDADAGAVGGIAIVGADTANGNWWFSVDNGATWAQLGAVSDTSALLLSRTSTARVFFQPAADFNGSATYTVSAGSVTETATVNVNVIPANDPPITQDPADPSNPGTPGDPEPPGQTFDPSTGDYKASTSEDTTFHGRIGASDPDGDILSYTLQSGPRHGAVTVDPQTGRYTYTPDPDYNGEDSFVITVGDGHGAEVPALVNMTVTPVADIVDDVVSAPPGASTIIRVLDNDSFEDAGRTITAVNGQSIAVGDTVEVAHGTVTLQADGTLRFTPASDFDGSIGFTYTVSAGGVFETAAVQVLAGTTDFYKDPASYSPDPYREHWGDSYRAEGERGLYVVPAVIRAVNGAGSLDGTPELQSMDGVVLQAVNGIASLNGITGASEVSGIVDHAVNKVDSLRGVDLPERDQSPPPRAWVLLPGLLGHADATPERNASLQLGGDSHIQLELVQRGAQTWVTMGSANSGPVLVTLADGRPLPEWVKSDGRGLVVIERPAGGAATLHLRVRTEPRHGPARQHIIEIDLDSGQMRELAPQGVGKSAGARSGPTAQRVVPSFAAQLDHAVNANRAQDDRLLELLG
ncbi:MAG: tandem-95 repeat protein [Proteobacteria bacterium]|nr:tandem-95 repeat protein [Pseudomonadota bacterium]